MANAEVYERCVTLTWEIKNFGLLLETVVKEEIFWSPVWKVEHNGGNRWFALCAFHTDSYIEFGMLLQGVCFSDQGVTVEDRSYMSIISSSGEVPLKKVTNNSFIIEVDAVYGSKKQSMLPNNALTLCCRIRGETMKSQELRICSVLCSLKYLWNIQHFNSSRSYDTFFEQDNFLLYVSLHAKSEEGTHMVVVQLPYAERCASIVNCAISITNGCEHIGNKTCKYPYVKWTCDIEKFPEKQKRIDVQFRSIVSLHKVCQIFKHDKASGAVSGSRARADDFLLLYRDSTLSDATLNTEGKSFSAHRSILAARSPVFRAMFEKDEMSEGRSGVVDIDDVDSETMDRMLVFLYGETLDDAQWEEASALYYAADKYDILSLKHRCVDILKAGLSVGNACDALVLADTHSDEQLKKYVVDFIRDHREVFSSLKWESLEESNSRLTTKVLREVYVKKEK